MHPKRSVVEYTPFPVTNGDEMDMEDTSEQDTSEVQGKLGREEKQSVQGYIAIKGTRNGLLLTLEPETPFGELLSALAERLAEAPSFFRGASLAVDTSRRSLQVSERTQLETLLAHYEVSVTSLEQTQTQSRSQAQVTFQTVPISQAQSAPIAEEPEISPEPTLPSPFSVPNPTSTGTETEQTQRDPRDSNDTLFLRRTVRSGQAIRHPSSVVVLGDVNPGAEIVAGGDIIVWGVLRGMVHAGYPDNEQALVCALQLAPVQLRIAHLLSRPPEGFEVQPRPEVASIRQGQIVVETWVNGRSPRK
jgi:septum site-determining protein MinC